ncbi:hypothetical protein RIF29_28531 [Crotalaria pallida]|uniref:Uncharacterized protein n=1 Tax=Crotalaria pallida TaxID=3830 RepID=A0AAN9HT22_CROPI
MKCKEEALCPLPPAKRKEQRCRKKMVETKNEFVSLVLVQGFNFSVSPSQSQPFLLKFSVREPGGAGYIGSHATLQLLKDSYRVAIVDNLSRKNLATVKVLQNLFRNLEGFNLFMLIWEMQNLYPYNIPLLQ